MLRLSVACLCLFLACFLIPVETARAQTGGRLMACSKQKPGQVRVMVTTAPIRYDNSKTEAELQRFQIDTVNPYGSNVETHVGGLMSGGLQLKSNVELAWETNKIQNCFWYKMIDVTIHIEPTVYIAREQRPGSCRYNAVMQHEMKHVAADRDVAKYWRPRIENYLRAQVQRVGVLGPYPIAQNVAARAKMTDYIHKALEIASEPMHQDRKSRQQGIDNRAEYERVNALCP